MNKWIKKRIWRMGAGLLRLAGLNIPEVAYKNQLVPVPQNVRFRFPAGGDALEAKKRLRSAENELLNLCRPYIHVEHTDRGDHIEVRLKIIVQRYERQI